MPKFLSVDELATQPEGTVIMAARSGQVARAGWDPGGGDDGARWLLPGGTSPVGERELAGSASWQVLRYGATNTDAPLPMVGEETFSLDGGLVTVRRVDDDVSRPVAMCSSPEWGRFLVAALNAGDVEAHPHVLAAAQRVTDLRAEFTRQQKARDRLDENTRQAVASILGALGLSMNLPRVGTTPALVAIRDEIRRRWTTTDETVPVRAGAAERA